jgi:hypothetical protein
VDRLLQRISKRNVNLASAQTPIGIPFFHAVLVFVPRSVH